MAEIIDIKETENPLFNRKEVVAIVKSEATPSKTKVEEALLGKLKVEKDVLKVKKIAGSFGTQEFEVSADVYKTAEDKTKYEVKTKQEKEAEKKAAEEAAKGENKLEEKTE